MKVFNNFIKFSALISCIVFSSISFAIADPVQFVNQATTQLMNSLKANKHHLEDNPKKLNQIVNETILPYVDFDEMSLWVAGKSAWGRASKELRREFVVNFKELVVKTYAIALKRYTNESIEFLPFTGDPTAARVEVSSKIVRANKEDILVNYRLVQKEDKWLVYDVIIEGVSILQGFRAQFSDQIRLHGLEVVANRIKEHNARNEKNSK